ncbi:hydrolase [Xenorhabdus szentirmaii]|uniref:Esterase yheT n=1 Tax=Xenorhabdus szentirmaii DSM 16338 TaxID=1427518 RepID=W1J090_9GAMM|nr:MULTISPECIES: hydrolase [Xenorhabdus]MBD2792061.1 hydrolase [Xenorhabdus sp. CUL]MBD2805940.1 hydrolase [Xenorhabdus sp. ZM]MBD2821174.1 hydrolase [Xenorhabdus sp. 42]MBD2823978.1 hydrolase [Xenorhabdus sp. 5]PHM34730.1 hydrolase [Xenorhabdus szentirmaii DSM 16338]
MSKHFSPLNGASNPHLQTLLPRLLRRHPKLQPYWQRLNLPDDDFVDLAWSEDPATASHKPRLVIFHGLEGGFNSPYAHGLISACKEKGWLGVVMHFRGCSGEPNRQQRIYHSGETSDARYFLDWLTSTYGNVPTAAVGYSLGGNMLACYLAEERENARLDAAVIVSAPFMLEACSKRIEQGFSQVYQHYLLSKLKNNATRKLLHYPNSLPLSLAQLNSMKKLREFDNAITAKIHGFKDADDYYRQCSALPHLPNITKPLLIIHAKDDPFMAPEVIPELALLPPNIEYQLTEHGGHVGFVGGSLKKPEMWLEKRIPGWLTPYLEHSSTKKLSSVPPLSHTIVPT